MHLQVRTREKLVILDAAGNINDLRLSPGNALEKLKRNLKGFWSIRVNVQYRIIFQWENNDAYKVRLLDSGIICPTTEVVGFGCVCPCFQWIAKFFYPTRQAAAQSTT